MSAWPADPLPNPARSATNAGRLCNAPLIVRGNAVAHCTKQIKHGKANHNGLHSIEWAEPN